MTDLITMTQKEEYRIKILESYKNKKIKTQEEAAKTMDIWCRQFRRIWVKYKKSWALWIVNKSRWKQWNKKIRNEKLKQIESIIMEPEYYDFGPTLMNEKLEEIYKLKISTETLRKIMIKKWLRESKEKRKYKQYNMRPRRPNEWDLIQFDWSYHKWFEKRNGGVIDCLLLAVDDATGNIMNAKFDDNEWLEAVFDFWKEYVKETWVPREIYLDKFSTYKSNYPKATYEPDTPTRFWKVCWKLWIKLISANSPQAKWRVERYNKTLQDRLIKEMRLLWINDIKTANMYLKEIFIPEFNKKFWKKANNDLNLHRDLKEGELSELDWMFSKIEERVITNDYTISYKSSYYQLKKKDMWFYPKLKVEVQEQFNWNLRIIFRGKEIEYKKLNYKPISYSKKESEEEKKKREKLKKEKEKIRHENSKNKQKRYKYFKEELAKEGLSWIKLHKEASKMAVSNTN